MLTPWHKGHSVTPIFVMELLSWSDKMCTFRLLTWNACPVIPHTLCDSQQVQPWFLILSLTLGLTLTNSTRCPSLSWPIIKARCSQNAFITSDFLSRSNASRNDCHGVTEKKETELLVKRGIVKHPLYPWTKPKYKPVMEWHFLLGQAKKPMPATHRNHNLCCCF